VAPGALGAVLCRSRGRRGFGLALHRWPPAGALARRNAMRNVRPAFTVRISRTNTTGRRDRLQRFRFLFRHAVVIASASRSGSVRRKPLQLALPISAGTRAQVRGIDRRFRCVLSVDFLAEESLAVIGAISGHRPGDLKPRWNCECRGEHSQLRGRFPSPFFWEATAA